MPIPPQKIEALRMALGRIQRQAEGALGELGAECDRVS
jgi:hypothetical protein